MGEYECPVSNTGSDRLIFPNIPVADLDRARAFFAALGFSFNEGFCDDKALCMLVSDKAMVMLLKRPFFQEFLAEGRAIADTATHTGVMLAVSCATREAVDELYEAAIGNGGATVREPEDHGFMYGRAF